jgi:large subunit ribosomal protein L21
LNKFSNFAIQSFLEINKLLTMYAIVEIAGQQFKVEKNSKIFVNRLEQAEGEKVDFERVLLIDNEGSVSVGTPSVAGAKVTAKVLSHLKGDKVVVFKKKRRKGYKVKNGFRPYLTQIEIEDIKG